LVFEAPFTSAQGVSEIPWEASFKGKKLVNGVYTWMASVTYIDGFVQPLHGSLTILN
jgi:hypothetical protein